jgi:hypothetical protein
LPCPGGASAQHRERQNERRGTRPSNTTTQHVFASRRQIGNTVRDARAHMQCLAVHTSCSAMVSPCINGSTTNQQHTGCIFSYSGWVLRYVAHSLAWSSKAYLQAAPGCCVSCTTWVTPFVALLLLRNMSACVSKKRGSRIINTCQSPWKSAFRPRWLQARKQDPPWAETKVRLEHQISDSNMTIQYNRHK